MTAFIVQLAVVWMLLNYLYISALAVGAAAFGIKYREVSLGIGKELWGHGKVKLRAIPFGGYVKLEDTRDDPEYDPVDPATAFNRKPPYVRSLVFLTGCAVMVLVATLVLASAGIPAVTQGFRQIVVGAFAPGSTAQQYIQSAHDSWASGGFVTLLGVMAAKLAAFNLLPLPFMSGGQALLALLPTNQAEHPAWHMKLMQIATLPWLALMGSWAYAILYFAIGAGAR